MCDYQYAAGRQLFRVAPLLLKSSHPAPFIPSLCKLNQDHQWSIMIIASLIPGRRPGFRSAYDLFKLGSSLRLSLLPDAQNSPAKVKKQRGGCRNSPKRCIPGLVCIMSFQKQITHRKKFDQKYFFSTNIFSENIFWKNFFFSNFFFEQKLL